MKGTEKIIAHIQADAEAQADAILAQAEQNCASIRAAWDQKAKDLFSANYEKYEACAALSEACAAEPVQAIGTRFVLYRKNPDKKAGKKK